MMKHKDEIEKQLKRTENLYGDFGKVILDTINEIRKDDNLFITKLPDIPDVIKQIKKVRKKWASGNSPIHTQGTITEHVISTSIPTLNFTPTIILIQFPENMNNVFYPKYGEMLPLMNFLSHDGFSYYCEIIAFGNYANGPIELKVKKTPFNDLNSIKLIEFKGHFNNNYPQQNGGNKINWYAFE